MWQCVFSLCTIPDAVSGDLCNLVRGKYGSHAARAVVGSQRVLDLALKSSKRKRDHSKSKAALERRLEEERRRVQRVKDSNDSFYQNAAAWQSPRPKGR